MTATKPGGWRRGTAVFRRRFDLGILAVLVVSGGTLVALGGPSLADPDTLAGDPVPADDVKPLTTAALSCPALSPSKLAAQIMATTGFGPGGAAGLGGLDDADWQKWRPRTGARRTDRADAVVALARRTCHHVGELRAAGVRGDLWKAAVGAAHAGVPAVVTAGGVPAGAERHVDKVAAYALWYAKQDAFRPVERRANVLADRPRAVPVPDGYVDSVRAAGRLCPTVTPARVAAQLMAASAFDPNLRSADGAAGIAQFPPDLWEKYRLSRTASVWEPGDAIPALGAAMCDLAGQVTGLSGADPYVLALGAYQWGVDAVRRANGLPGAAIAQLGLTAPAYVADYEKDDRLRPAQPKPGTSAAPGRPAPSAAPPPASAAPARPGGSGSSAAPRQQGETGPADEPLPYEPGRWYRIRNVWAGSDLELPGADENRKSDVLVQLWKNPSRNDSVWRLDPAPSGAYAIITNKFSGKALGIRNRTKGDHGELVQLDRKTSDVNLHWELRDAGGGEFHLVNRNSGKALELIGENPGPRSDGTWNGVRVNQFPLRPEELDQRWRLIPL